MPLRTRAILAVAAFVLAVWTAQPRGRTDPRAPHAVAAPSAGAAFECGTYRGNQHESLAQYYAYKAKKKQIAANPASLLPAAQFVYDDVWVVEDDGTIIQSGSNDFDTPGTQFHFAPNVGGGYDVSMVPWNFDLDVGTDLGLGDDQADTLALGFSFSFFGTGWTEAIVSSNGAVTFGAPMNPSLFYDSNDFFRETPKIAAYYMDLDPSSGGSVNVKIETGKATITWWFVREYGTALENTFQLVLFDDGTFDVVFAAIASTAQNNGAPIRLGIHPGGDSPPAELISFSNGLPHTGGVGAAVYEEYINLPNPRVNEVALLNAFYVQFPDDFFQVIFFTNFVQSMAGFANELNIKNDVTGIGLGIFDNSALYGSGGVLESRCNMNRLGVWPADPATRFTANGNNFLTIMGQESGHRWGAFVYFQDAMGNPSNLILGRSDAHWSYFFDVDHSSLEGGNWELLSGSTYICPTQIDYFSELDEYLFGLRSADEVKDSFFISSPSNNLPGARDDGTPPQNATATGTPVVVTVEDIIAQEGPRTPPPSVENRDLRQAFVLVIRNGGTATQAELDKIAGFRRAWEPYFEVSCDGRITCNTSITSTFDGGVIRGSVTDRLTQQPVSDFTIQSVERGFSQHVPAGGGYEFRYLADSTSGASECATLSVEAPGFFPKTVNACATYGAEQPLDIKLDPIPSGIAEGVPLPDALYQNFPNPFNPGTTIRYDLGSGRRVRLEVFDVTGKRVRTLVDGIKGPGRNDAFWDGRDDAGRRVASGVYVYRLDAGDYVRTRKMLLLK